MNTLRRHPGSTRNNRVAAALLAASLLFAAAGAAGAAQKGRVVDGEGKPVPGAKVYVGDLGKDSASCAISSELQSDEQGCFEVADAVAGSLRCLLFAYKPGFAWGGVSLYAGMPVLKEISIVLLAPCKVAGKVTDKQGRPISGVQVRPNAISITSGATPQYFSATRGLPFLQAETDADGKFTLENLPTGARLFLSFDAPPGYASTTEPDYRAGVQMTAPKEDVVVQLAPESQVKGTLKHEKTGKPPTEVRIFAQERQGRGAGSAVTDANGAFVIRNLPAGDYSFNVRTTEDWGGVLNSKAPVSVAEGQTTENIQLTWTEGVLVEGSVLDAETKAPLASVSVNLSPAQPTETTRQAGGQSDAEGKFRFRALPGTYTLSAYSAKYKRFAQPGLVVGEATARQEILMATQEVISVLVVDGDGNPVPKAVVARWNRTVTTADDKGLMELSEEDRRRYGEDMLTVTSPDSALTGSFDVPEKPEKGLRWVLQKSGGITGIVQREDKTPIEGAEVQAYWIRRTSRGGTGGAHGMVVTTGADGKYTLKGLIAGQEYGIQAKAKGFGQSDAWNEKSYTIAAGVVADAQPVTLRKAEAVLTGQVVDPTGAGIPGVAIQLYGQRNQQFQATTDAQGKFRIDGLVPEDVNLNIGRNDRQAIYRRVKPEEFKDLQITIFPKFDPTAALAPGRPAPEIAGVEWISGTWNGFDAARGKSVAVAFVSIKNRNSRMAIRQICAAVQSAKDGGLQAVLVHDASATAAEIKEYLAANKVTLPVARGASEEHLGWFSSAFTAWQVGAIPTISLVGPDGKIAQGRIPLETLEQALAGK